jgi:3-deoxy-manno-octulosonate cytidylyltransferase (CMP-KDO synthetase)
MTIVRAVGIIPARYGATRFPGKPLADLCGKPMIQWVWEGACQSRSLSRIVVATDDMRIMKTVEAFGGEAVMTATHHASGTDRVAEVAKDMDADIVVNVQGDEPLLNGRIIDVLVSAFAEDGEVKMATLASRMAKDDDPADPNTVKIVTDKSGNALYFSRHPIPFVRTRATDAKWNGHLQHIGIYGFRKDFLLRFTSLDPTPLEQIEGLEQLRALEHGFGIKVVVIDHRGISVDTPDDLLTARRLMRKIGTFQEVHGAG